MLNLKVRIKEFNYKKKILSLLKTNIKLTKFPKLVVLQSLNRCNCGCSMCPYAYTVANETESRMTEELYLKIINELSVQQEFETLIFAFQNEPLLDARLIDWAKKFKKLMPEKTLELVTNGSLLTPEKAAEVYKYFSIVHVSLNAFSAETHMAVTNTKHYDQVVTNLTSIASNQEWTDKTIIRFIRQKMNYKEKKPFYRHWRRLGFMVFGFDVNDRLKGVKDFENKIKLPANLLVNIKMTILKYLGLIILPTCPIPFICIYLKANGDVVQCFNDWSNNHILGNVTENSIMDIFANEKYVEIRTRLLAGNLNDNVICSQCDLYKEGVWLTV